jgi:hypothetical protein
MELPGISSFCTEFVTSTFIVWINLIFHKIKNSEINSGRMLFENTVRTRFITV